MFDVAVDRFHLQVYNISIKKQMLIIEERDKWVRIMLKILDEKVLRTVDDIEDQYKDCKYVTLLDSYDQIADNDGYLYCVSTSNESFDDLITELYRLENEGKICVLGGSYNNGGAVGVQYEYK